MRELLKSRRNYCIFIALAFLATFVLPQLLRELYNSLQHLILPIDYLSFYQFILSLIRAAMDILKPFPTALLLFAAMRWTFWYSVPVVFGNILYLVLIFIGNMVQPGLSPQYLFSLIIFSDCPNHWNSGSFAFLFENHAEYFSSDQKQFNHRSRYANRYTNCRKSQQYFLGVYYFTFPPDITHRFFIAYCN